MSPPATQADLFAALPSGLPEGMVSRFLRLGRVSECP
jgi:hypothetical protein